ncbi:MAG: DUF971 domain-containing protein [Phycisphaerales bacterium]|nr:DUF971 domain-containing protein [Phycisphaerales bacterium]
MQTERPTHLDLDRNRGLSIAWADGTTFFLTLPILRRFSPSADARELRKAMAANPLTVLPSNGTNEPLTALGAEFVGNYALKIHFSDGHSTGIYAWSYLRELCETHAAP